MSGELRVSYAGILVNLTEQVLAVNQLQWPAPKRRKIETQTTKLVLLAVGDKPDQISVIEPTRIGKALPKTVLGTGARNNELHLRKIEVGRVVEVGNELVGEKVTYRWVRAQQFKSGFHRSSLS